MFSHLQEEKISYTDHWKLSMGYSLNFATASVKAIFHAFFPNLFQTSTSDLVSDLHKKMNH